jgi:hypothetical protein
MSEYVKDSTKADGWRVISYASKGNKHKGEEGAPITADAMSAEDDGMSEGEEAPDSSAIRSRL